MGFKDDMERDVAKKAQEAQYWDEVRRRLIREVEEQATKEALKMLSKMGIKCSERDVFAVNVPSPVFASHRFFDTHQDCTVAVRFSELNPAYVLRVDVRVTEKALRTKVDGRGVYVQPASGSRNDAKAVSRLADLAAYLKK
jgi:hypothetical protein